MLKSISYLVYGLISDSIHRSIHHSAIVLDDLLDWITLSEIDRYTSNLLRLVQSFRYLINDIDATSTSEHSRICGHQSYRTATEDRKGFAGLEAAKSNPMPTGWEDVSEQSEIRFVLSALRKCQAVEIRIWDTDILRLASVIRTM